MNNSIKRALITGAITLAAIGTAAVPALASSNPPGQGINATATVPTAITLALSTNTLAFGSVTPGVPSSVISFTETVTSNDAAGYASSWNPPNPGSDLFKNTAGTVSFPVKGALFLDQHGAATPLVPDADSVLALGKSSTVSAASGDTYMWDTQLTAPGNAPGANYSAGPFLVIVTGN